MKKNIYMTCQTGCHHAGCKRLHESAHRVVVATGSNYDRNITLRKQYAYHVSHTTACTLIFYRDRTLL
jgi:hypothetical protein